jgi:hypothetical protein
LFLSVGWGFGGAARAQAIAYTPVIGLVPSGETLTVTPVVSADRRYVRLGVDAFFNNFNFFTTFSFPGGAVSGGFAGMNGAIGAGGFGGGGLGTGSGAGIADEVGYVAGPLPFDAGFDEFGVPFRGMGDPLDPSSRPAPNAGPLDNQAADQGLPAADPAFPRAGHRTHARASTHPVPRQRRPSPRKSSRRATAAARLQSP